MLEGKRWFLVDLNRPEDKDTPYIILESLNSEKNSSRTIHTVNINTDQSNFSLGRGHDSELRINDISVSRKHASLEYKNGEFVLTDLKSKFGTLMLISDTVELTESNNKTFQIGRTVVTIKAKSETPWKNRGDDRGMAVDHHYKGEEYQRVEALLRDTKGLNRDKKYDRHQVKDDNYQQKDVEHELDQHLNMQRAVSFNPETQEKKVIEVNGKRYIVLKELDDDPNDPSDE